MGSFAAYLFYRFANGSEINPISFTFHIYDIFKRKKLNAYKSILYVDFYHFLINIRHYFLLNASVCASVDESTTHTIFTHSCTYL